MDVKAGYAQGLVLLTTSIDSRNVGDEGPLYTFQVLSNLAIDLGNSVYHRILQLTVIYGVA